MLGQEAARLRAAACAHQTALGLKKKNTKITTVIETINQYFDKDVKLTLKDSTCLFTGNFDNPNYDQVLEVLKFTYDLNVENKNNTSRLIINKCK